MTDKIELKDNDTIVFIGDSITDAGRFELAYQPFGNGYVHFTANYLLAKYTEWKLNIINAGISGNTILDLKSRWLKDCIEHKPDILSVLIGVNDVHCAQERGFGEAYVPEKFLSNYEVLLSQAKKHRDCQLVLIEPFMFCDNTNIQVFADLAEYIKAVHVVAEKFDAAVVPLQKLIDEKIKTVPPFRWSGDSVHPFEWAHFWISQQWIKTTKL